MQIFVTDKSPVKSAQALDDKRVVKMCLETCQLLSTAMYLNGVEGYPYKPTHIKHPCTKWVSRSRGNFCWLLRHFKALLMEYTKRYKKRHKCSDHIRTFENAVKYLSCHKRLEFENCTTFKSEEDPIVAYKQYLFGKWLNDKREPRWTNTQAPDWLHCQL